MRAQMIRARAGEARNVRDLQSLVVLVPSDVVPFGSGTIAACVSLLFGVHDAVVSTLLLFVEIFLAVRTPLRPQHARGA